MSLSAGARYGAVPLWLAVTALSLSSVYSARAAEITLIAPGGIRAAVERLAPDFERRTGHKVTRTYASGGGTKDRVLRGEAFDVPIVQPPLEGVVASGHVVAASATPLATVAVGLAVKSGAKKPDIATAEAVKRTLLAASALAYPDAAAGAAAGVSFNKTLQQLGIADTLRPKLKIARNGAAAMAMLAHGEVELGVTFVSEILTEPGIDFVGPLPRDISTPTGFVAFVSAAAKDPEAAKAFVAFLAGPEAAVIFKAQGMQPGS